MSGDWVVERAVGSAGAFHAQPLPVPPRRTVWVHEIDRPAFVLGSTQPDTVADAAALDAARVELVRRRSGGGAVLLVPGEVLWVDVIVPAGDRWWDADVGRAACWLGDAWAAALAACGLDGLAVHRGAMVRRPWSDRICFAGLGPGEVTQSGSKVVGISQRRTRDAARFQCAALARFDVDAVVALLAPPRPTAAERAALAGAVATLDVPVAAVEAALLDVLAAR